MKKATVLLIILYIGVFSLFASSAYDAEYLLKDVIYRLNPDGSSVMEYHSKIKLYTYKATNRIFGETFILYNPAYQKLEILMSETTMKDGKKVKSPKNAYNESLPYVAKRFSAFSELREMVVTHTGLERDAVIELKYKIYTKAGFNNCFSKMEYLSEPYPVKKLSIRVIVPKDKLLNVYVSEKGVLKNAIKENNIEYSIIKTSVDNYKHEPLDNKAGRGYIIFSTAKNWIELLSNKYKAEDIPKAMIKTAKKILKSTDGKFSKLFKLQELIVSDFDYCRINYKLTGNRIRNIKDVYSSNYARAIEKTYLLSGLLSKLGIKNEIILAFQTDKFKKNIPNLAFFNTYFLKITNYSNTTIYIDPVHLQNNIIPMRLYGQTLYNLNTGKSKKLKNSCFKKNMIEIRGDINFIKKGYKGKLIVGLSGIYFNYKSSLKNKKKYLKRVLSHMIGVSKLSKLKIINYTVDSIKAEITVEGKLLKHLNKKTLILKDFNFKLINPDNVFLKQRTMPMLLSAANGISIKLNVHYPKKLIVDYVITVPKIDNKLGTYYNSIKKIKKGLIELEYIRLIKNNVILPKDYKEFKKVVDNILSKKNLIIFKNK